MTTATRPQVGDLICLDRYPFKPMRVVDRDVLTLTLRLTPALCEMEGRTFMRFTVEAIERDYVTYPPTEGGG